MVAMVIGGTWGLIFLVYYTCEGFHLWLLRLLFKVGFSFKPHWKAKRFSLHSKWFCMYINNVLLCCWKEWFWLGWEREQKTDNKYILMTYINIYSQANFFSYDDENRILVVTPKKKKKKVDFCLISTLPLLV